MQLLRLLPVLLAISFTASAQPRTKSKTPVAPSPEQRLANIDAQLNALLADWHGAGFAVSVVHKDKLVWAKGYGYRDLAKKLPVTPNTLFAIGSCTKAFTSSLLGVLQKDGKLDYDKPASTYLPALRFATDELTNAVTVRDMMCHRTGLPRHDYSWYLTPASRDSLLMRVAHLEVSAPLRQRWQYNNFMFLAQGVLAEKLTGKPWETLIRETFFEPLGMKTSNTSVRDMAKQADAAIGYELVKDSVLRQMAYYNIDGMGPAGSINSSATEMANWVRTWINGGKFGGKDVLPAAYVPEAMSSQMVIGAGLPTPETPDVLMSNYGFGWFLAAYRGHYRVEHGGNIDGFSASTCFFPSDSIGIVVLTNQNSSALPSLVRNIVADRLLGLPAFDWSADRKKTMAKAKEAAKLKGVIVRKPNAKASHPLADLAGVYTHPGYGTVEIVQKGDSLFLPAASVKLWLQHLHYDVFEPFDTKDGIDTSDHGPVRVQFVMNPAGDIDGLQMHGIEPMLAKPIAFKKGAKAQPLTADALKKYEGEFSTGALAVKIYVDGAVKLFAAVPGQPDYELVPVGNDRFTLKILPGYSVQFANTNGSVAALTFEQPNGNFKLTRKTAAPVSDKK
jgi:CubicO group peptidase (beta-lactamase class C family)